MLRLLAFIYLTLSAATPPCLAADGSPKRPRPRGQVTIDQLVAKLRTEGQPWPFPAVLAKLTGFSGNSTRRGFEASSIDTTDGVNRVVALVLDMPVSGGSAVPAGLYWNTKFKALEPRRVCEGYDYRSGLDGSLRQAVRVDCQVGDDGNMIRGASKVTELDGQSKEVQERFQREVVDFWLKGKGRRKARSKPSAAKQP